MSVPEKKFLRDGFIGLVRAGHPIVCQMAREVPNQGSKYTTRVKRLDLHLTVENDFDERIKECLPTVWVPLVREETLTMIVARSPGNEVLVMLYLAWLYEKHLPLAERLIDYAQVLPEEADFLFYRLLTGMTHLHGRLFLSPEGPVMKALTKKSGSLRILGIILMRVTFAQHNESLLSA